MNVFIAGATGVLGRRVVPRLIAAGHRVAGLSRSENNARTLSESGAEPRAGNLFDPNEMLRISRGSDAILHLATAIPTGARPKKQDWSMNDRIRREGTVNLVAAAVANRCKFYLQQSITFLYGDRAGAWVDETTPIASPLATVTRSAAEMERIVIGAVERKALAAAVLRFGAFYSYDSASTAGMFEAIRAGRFPVIGGGKAYWNLISVDDAAEAIVTAVANAGSLSGEIINVCDDEPAPYGDIVGFIASVLGARRPRRIPALAARMLAGSDAVDFLLSSARCRNDKAKKILGWRPQYPTYREGVKVEVTKWLESKGRR